MKPSKYPTADAGPALAELLEKGFAPNRLDELYDTLKLLGVVLGQLALLDVIADPTAEAAAKVSAARALTSLKESPESISERLRRSPFSHLTAEQLAAIVQEVKQGNTDLQALIAKHQ